MEVRIFCQVCIAVGKPYVRLKVTITRKSRALICGNNISNNNTLLLIVATIRKYFDDTFSTLCYDTAFNIVNFLIIAAAVKQHTKIEDVGSDWVAM